MLYFQESLVICLLSRYVLFLVYSSLDGTLSLLHHQRVEADAVRLGGRRQEVYRPEAPELLDLKRGELSNVKQDVLLSEVDDCVWSFETLRIGLSPPVMQVLLERTKSFEPEVSCLVYHDPWAFSNLV